MASSAFAVSIDRLEANRVEVVCTISRGISKITFDGASKVQNTKLKENLVAVCSSFGLALPSTKIRFRLEARNNHPWQSGMGFSILASALCEMGLIDQELLSEHLLYGQFSRSGTAVPRVGSLVAALLAHQLGMRFVCPPEQLAEVSEIPELYARSVRNAFNLSTVLTDEQPMTEVIKTGAKEDKTLQIDCESDLSELDPTDRDLRQFELDLLRHIRTKH